MLAQLTSEHITSLIALAALTVNMVLIPLVTYVISRQKKSETTIMNAGAERETRLSEKLNVVEKKADASYEAANNLKESHSQTIAIATQALEKLNKEPVQVEVMNTPEHPIPTERTNP